MIAAQEAPVNHAIAALEEVTAAAGLTLEEVVTLIMAGVGVTDLLNYAEAVVSNRLN